MAAELLHKSHWDALFTLIFKIKLFGNHLARGFIKPFENSGNAASGKRSKGQGLRICIYWCIFRRSNRCFYVLLSILEFFFQESEMETEEEVDILMSSDIYSATLSTKSITFTRAQTGWLFREDKTVSGRKLRAW